MNERCLKCKRPNNMGNSPNAEECTETDDEEGVCEAYAKIASLTDHIDLMRDDFLRIKACPGCDSEIAQLCDRAIANIHQWVPVIVQRDKAETERNQLKLTLTAARDRISELLPYAERHLERSNEESRKDPDPESRFYGEDIVTYPLISRAKHAIKEIDEKIPKAPNVS